MKVIASALLLFAHVSHAYVSDIPTYSQFERMGASHQLDAKDVYSLALAESGHWVDTEFVPHPYAISLGYDDSIGQLKHEGFYPETKLEAKAILRQLLKAGYTNIGIGMMQVNIKANPDIVEDYTSLLDPMTNLQAASKVLKWCRRYKSSNDVFACYSHGDARSEKGQQYASRVITYSDKYAHQWEKLHSLPSNGVYSFEQFVRVAKNRSSRYSATDSRQAQARAITIVTQ